MSRRRQGKERRLYAFLLGKQLEAKCADILRVRNFGQNGHLGGCSRRDQGALLPGYDLGTCEYGLFVRGDIRFQLRQLQGVRLMGITQSQFGYNKIRILPWQALNGFQRVSKPAGTLGRILNPDGGLAFRLIRNAEVGQRQARFAWSIRACASPGSS